MSQKPLYAYVGTYTTENSKGNRNAHGVGIYVYEISRTNGRWKLVQEMPALNPAVLQFGKDQKYVYCVNSNSGGVTAFLRDGETGMLTELNRAETDGNNIMIMSVDRAGEYMVTGDHKGIVNVFHLEADGTIGKKTDSFVLPGEKGPLNEKIQPWSRPHHLPFSPDGRYVLIADKGLDIVHSYAIDREIGKLSLGQQLKCHGASCPRHLWFHPNGEWVYINTEYTSTIIACRYDREKGTLEPFQVVSALPDDYFDVNTMTSELVVHPNGKFLYISNRRVNNIGAFSINQKTGRLSPIGWVPCGGKKPRFFAIEPGGRYLFNGNQSSDTITLFAINQETGELEATGKVLNTPTPVWILFTDAVESIEEFGEKERGVINMSVGNRVFLQRELPDMELVKRYQRLPAANVADTMSRSCALNSEIHLISSPDRPIMAGPALTVKARPGDNLMLHKALDMAQEGDVIVVSNDGDRTHSLMGEIMAVYAQNKRKVAGIVLDGPIRDMEELSQMSLFLYATGSTPGGPYKEGPGEINVPISIGNIAVKPGDIILGDRDGVIVIPQEDAASIIDGAEAYAAMDAGKVEEAKNGTSKRQWVEDTLAKKNVEIIDGTYKG